MMSSTPSQRPAPLKGPSVEDLEIDTLQKSLPAAPTHAVSMPIVKAEVADEFVASQRPRMKADQFSNYFSAINALRESGPLHRRNLVSATRIATGRDAAAYPLGASGLKIDDPFTAAVVAGFLRNAAASSAPAQPAEAPAETVEPSAARTSLVEKEAAPVEGSRTALDHLRDGNIGALRDRVGRASLLALAKQHGHVTSAVVALMRSLGATQEDLIQQAGAAAERGDVASVGTLIRQTGISVNHKIQGDYTSRTHNYRHLSTLLFLAAKAGRKEMVNFLIGRGATPEAGHEAPNVHFRHPVLQRETPLEAAIANNHLDVVEVLAPLTKLAPETRKKLQAAALATGTQRLRDLLA